MKKSLITALILTMLVSLGTAFAQTDSHDVVIKIPSILSVRIVDSSGGLAGSPIVNFDFRTTTANRTKYIDAVNAGGADLAPTSTPDFSDLQVFSNYGTWSLYVKATDPLSAFTSLDTGITSGAGISLSDIVVTPSGTPGASDITVATSFPLDITTAVATGKNTSGWKSVGISGNDYTLHVNGDENPGAYTSTVTYQFTAP